MKRATITAAFLTTCLTSGALAQTDRYSAIAISPSSGQLGEARDEPSLEAVRDAALRDCGATDCIIAASTVNGCVAAAISLERGGQSFWYGFADDVDQATTERSALSICEVNAHGYCQVLTSFCTSGDDVVNGGGNVADVLAEIGDNNTPAARGIVNLVNIASARYLLDNAHISRGLHDRLLANGNIIYATLRDLVSYTDMSASDLRQIWGYAQRIGYIHE